ncbi:hypothetical protein QBC47DRAFT_442317 [Echria macrotheca]|uniref:Uncharacterized protein n=1 Tax=Echria macrotheca TaxID=438768 RepID=A0AAJ0BGE5_9PEZI|nr:hypothetical protein QBC47DRAFT_442317 [Echria macrotheca]
MSTTFKIPQITQTDLQTFFTTHFSPAATQNFQHTFLSPDPNRWHDPHTHTHLPHDPDPDHEWEDEEEDDGLGYYEDGVKRTLTDEQIAIFRHSEVEQLRRRQEKAVEQGGEGGDEGEGSEEGEVSTPVSGEGRGNGNGRKKRRRKKKKGKGEDLGEVVDLRKRTWDVVAEGLGSLDYGEEEGGRRTREGGGEGIGRRVVCYDDEG